MDERAGADIPGYPGVHNLIRVHRDAPLTPRARALWWLAGTSIVTAGIVVILLSR